MAWRGGRLLLAAALGTAVLLLLLGLRGGGPVDGLRGAVGALAGPAERGLASVRAGWADRFGGAGAQRARIAELEQDLASARSQAAAAAAGTLSQGQMRELAAVLPASGYRAVPGRLVSLSSPRDLVRSAAISVGTRSGVAVGDAVVAPDGLVGVVDSVAPRVATVRLAVDAASALPARVAPTGEVGVLRGTGSGARLTLLDPLGAMGSQDLVVTLGSDGTGLPAGLPVGRVARVTGSAGDLTRQGDVTPAVDDSTLDRVVVLVPEDRP